MGRLARPTLVAQALAPTAGAAILAQAGAPTTLLLVAALAVGADMTAWVEKHAK